MAKLLEHEAHPLWEKSEPFSEIIKLGAILAPVRVTYGGSVYFPHASILEALQKEEWGPFQEPASLYAQSAGSHFQS